MIVYLVQDVIGALLVFLLTCLAISITLKYPVLPIHEQARTQNYKRYTHGFPALATVIYVILVLLLWFVANIANAGDISAESNILAMVHGPLYSLIVLTVVFGAYATMLNDVKWREGYKKIVKQKEQRVLQPAN